MARVRAVEFPGFGGLDFSVDPQQEQFVGAVDAMDVVFDSPGRLRTRSGARFIRSNYTPVGATALAMKYTGIAPLGSEIVVLSTSGTSLQLSGDGSGLIRTVALASGSSAAFFAELGTPTTTYLAFTSDAATGTYANAATTLSGAYGGGPLAVTKDNRLMICKGSRVRFSVAGDPTTYNANDYVDVTPGDGEFIAAAITYGNDTLVFKQTKFFVFYGNSTDGTGNPVFNYRMVNTGHGAANYNAACAAPEGVYFVDRSGAWLTTGGGPRKVSDKLDRLFTTASWSPTIDVPYTSAQLLAFFSGSYSATIAGDLLVVNMISPGGSNGILALHRPSGQWTAWSINAGALCGQTAGAGEIAYVKRGTRELYRIARDQTVDQDNTGATSPVTARWRSGFWNPGQPGSEAWVREWLLDGSGAITVKTSVNDAVTLGTGAVTTLGAWPTIAQGRDRRGLRGRDVSVELSGPMPWLASRAVANVWSQTAPGMRAA